MLKTARTFEWAEIKAEVMIGGKGEYKASQKAG